jgi:hypothetical protein
VLLACKDAGSVHGEKTAMIAHLIGPTNQPSKACNHVSETAKTEARAERVKIQAGKGTKRVHDKPETEEISSDHGMKRLKQAALKVYRAVDMPFGEAEAEELRLQATRAIISTNSAYDLWQDPEMQKFIGMLRGKAKDIVPTQKVASGRLLNVLARTADEKLKGLFYGKEIGIS